MVFGGPLECRNSTAPHTLSFITAVVSSLLMLITVPGNLLICVAVVKDPCKSLRTPFNLFLLNISAADLVVGVGVLPLSIAYHTMEGMATYYSALIKTLHLVFFISCSASVLGIAALSLDRYICVTSPLKYRSRLTTSRVKKVSLSIWLISVVCPFVYLYVDFIIYTFVFANGTILFTLIILVFVNQKIYRGLNAQRKILQSLTDGKNMTSRLIQRDVRVTKTFLFFLGSFLVLTVPPLSFSYVLNFSTACDCQSIHIIRDLEFLSILFPSSLNPFIYALRLPNFRKAIRVLACKMVQNFVSNLHIWDSCPSEALNRQFRRDSGAEANQSAVISKTNAKTEATRNHCEYYPKECVSLDVNYAVMSTLNVNTHLEFGMEQAIKEHGISHFYRVTANL